MTAGKEVPGIRKLINVLALSEDEAVEFTSSEPYIVISINDPGEKPVKLMSGPNLKGVLRLQFWDADRADAQYPPISGGQAMQAARFVRDYPGVSLIVCHCRAGISRSAGMAAAIARWRNGDRAGDRFFKLTKYLPNRYVHDQVYQSLMLLGR